MTKQKKIVYLTGTRADFGKQKALIKTAMDSNLFDTHIFATGMHLNVKYGKTVEELYKCGFKNKNIFRFINHLENDSMDRILAKTIEGFSYYVNGFVQPDLIVVHGDRVEALAGAIVGSLNNILVAHIEGGEVSGTIDELIRHAISKLSHAHFVANEEAKVRLLQMGEDESSVFITGSPDVDIMGSDKLPSLKATKEYYEIPFDSYAILLFHPVTTEYNDIPRQIKNVVDAVIESGDNYIVCYPNNDYGSEFIFAAYKEIENNKRFIYYPSFRFEYFLTLLKNAAYIIGNSSAGIREAPYYGIPAINIGTRQNRRALSGQIINSDYSKENILSSIGKAVTVSVKCEKRFGRGNSSQLFFDIITDDMFWSISRQKLFKDIKETCSSSRS